MATSPHLVAATSIAITEPRRNPLVLWHLLSLDAPTVAMLWTWFIAHVNGVHLPATAVVAMGTTVWLLYAADRLLDARLIASHDSKLEPRHHFHRLHQRPFGAGIVIASCVLATLLPRLNQPSIHLYLTLGVLLFGYFVLIHLKSDTHHLPKELAVGFFFSAAVFIPTVAREPSVREFLLPAAILFAALCSLNCLFIYKWEHGTVFDEGQTSAATGLALRFLILLAIGVAAIAITLAIADLRLPRPISAAIASAAGLLLLLDRNHRRLNPTTLRAAADLCLLTPLLFLPFY